MAQRGRKVGEGKKEFDIALAHSLYMESKSWKEAEQKIEDRIGLFVSRVTLLARFRELNLPSRPSGRPKEPTAMSATERSRKFRARKKRQNNECSQPL